MLLKKKKFLAVLGLRCFAWVFCSCIKGNYSLVVGPWLLIVVASLIVEQWPLAAWMDFSSCSGRAQQLRLTQS